MRKSHRLFLGCVGALFLAGCDKRPSEFTVEYYSAHPQERRQKIAECASDPGALREDALCINATEAETSEAIGKWRELPPMNLPMPEKRDDSESSPQR
jgi:hypothetical protein